MQKENKGSVYGKLFTSTLKLSACTFGGGFVIVPLMRRRFVEELHWIEEEEMLDLTAIAQSTPGAIAVNASIIVGYRVAGLAGALIAALGTVLPPLVIISVVSVIYDAIRDNALVGAVMTGMLAGVAAVVTDVVLSLSQGILKLRRALPLLVLLGAFAAVRIFGVNIMLVMLACGAIGAADVLLSGRGKGGERK